MQNIILFYVIMTHCSVPDFLPLRNSFLWALLTTFTELLELDWKHFQCSPKLRNYPLSDEGLSLCIAERRRRKPVP